MLNHTPLRHFLARAIFYYGLSPVLAGFVRAWALGANLWSGVVPGAVLGLLAVLLLGTTGKQEAKADGFDALGYLGLRAMAVLFLLALSIVGAIVGVGHTAAALTFGRLTTVGRRREPLRRSRRLRTTRTPPALSFARDIELPCEPGMRTIITVRFEG